MLTNCYCLAENTLHLHYKDQTVNAVRCDTVTPLTHVYQTCWPHGHVLMWACSTEPASGLRASHVTSRRVWGLGAVSENWNGFKAKRGGKSTFCPHSVFMCFVWIWEQTAIISLNNINWLVCITETECVYCAVRTGSLYVIQVNHSLVPSTDTVKVYRWKTNEMCWKPREFLWRKPQHFQ